MSCSGSAIRSARSSSLGFLYFAPARTSPRIDNDLTMWVSKTDPVYQTYERFRTEFGGQRMLLVALKSERVFTPEGLAFIRQVTADIERVRLVDRVQSLSTANLVRSLPAASPDDEAGLEVRPLLDGELNDRSAADVRRRVLDDPLLRGDLVSLDGTVTVIMVSLRRGPDRRRAWRRHRGDSPGRSTRACRRACGRTTTAASRSAKPTTA